MEYLAVVRLRAIADAAAASALQPTEGDNTPAQMDGALVPASVSGVVDKAVSTSDSKFTPPPKSKGIKGPILLCVSCLTDDSALTSWT